MFSVLRRRTSYPTAVATLPRYREEPRGARSQARIKQMSMTVACLCALVCCLELAAAQGASAAVTHEYLSQITEIPASAGVASPGPLFGVNAMAIDSGDLYVAEEQSYPAPERLDEFNASSGAFVRQFALPSSLHGYYFFGLAAGHATGEQQVYAGAFDEEFKNVVAVFDGEGHMLGSPWTGSDTPQGSFSVFGIGGIAADSSTSLGDWAVGDVYVSDVNNKVVDVFKPLPGGKEEYVAQIEGPETGVPFAAPSLVAVDQTNGDVAVVDEEKMVDIFEPTGPGKYALVRKVTGTPAGPFHGIEYSFSKGLAVDSNGDIYVREGVEPAVVYEFSATGEYIGRLTGTPARPFYWVRGLAVDPETNKLYVGESDNSQTEEPGAIDIFGPNLVIPDVTTGPASSITPGSATVDGTVNPDNAGETTCQVVWGPTPAFGKTTQCPSPPSPIENGENPVPIQVPLTELTPDTTYHFRLQASNVNGLNEGEPYQDQEFHTSGPGIHQVWTTDVGSSSVTLSAKIDPNGAATTYYFQYGTSSSYGTDVPIAPGASIGSASGDVTVERHVQELSAATTYHYRVVALSEPTPGSVVEFTSSDQTFTTQSAASGFNLPDGRAWEMVSPPNKDGAALEAAEIEFGSTTQASVNGDAISYTANGPTEDQPPSNRAVELTQVYSTRTTDGWTSKDINTPFSKAGHYELGQGSEFRMFSSDLSAALVYPFSETPPLSSEASELTPYLRRNASCEADPAKCYVPLVTTADVAPGVKWAENTGQLTTKFVYPIIATPDAGHVILRSAGGTLLPGGSKETAGLYEWGEGKLQLVTILPNEEPAAEGGRLGYQERLIRHAISDDGARVVFEAGNHLYTRNTAIGKTEQVDALESGAHGGEGRPVFQLASSDGLKVFFTDTARLTRDATSVSGSPDLYEFNVETGEVTDLTVDTNPGEHANVQGLVQGASEDGSYVYFAADGVLASGATPGSNCDDQLASATCNLYVRHAGVTTYIATLSGSDQGWGNEIALERLGYVAARVSPDGRWFAFTSDRSLTGYDNRDAVSGEPDEEVFLYDASTTRLRCVSCNPTGARPLGMLGPKVGTEHPGPLVDRGKIWEDHWYASLIPGWEPESNTGTGSVYQARYLSNSGRLFFNSSDALVPRDVNGTMDVYEYEPEGVGDCAQKSTTFGGAANGCVNMISSGSSDEEAAFVDASENGDDAFFLTAAKLRPEDFDSALDLYDARVCSLGSPCLPTPAPVVPPCVTGDGCKPAPTPQPGIFGAAPSATFSGIGNVSAASTPSVTSRSLTRAQKLAAALRACKRKRGKRKRAVCVREARKRYASKPSGKRSSASHAGVSTITRGR